MEAEGLGGDRTEAAKAWIWNSNGAWAAGWACGSRFADHSLGMGDGFNQPGSVQMPGYAQLGGQIERGDD